MSNEFDVVIVGGGPGGSTCASFLSKHGMKTLLLDSQKFPRDKTCGDGISGKSVRVLRELGLIDKVNRIENAKIHGVTISSPNGSVARIPIPQKKGYIGEGFVSRREVFDNFLFENAKSKENVTVIEKFQVTDLLKNGDHVVGVKGKNLETGEEQSFSAKVVVGADGANSVVARLNGLSKIEPEHFLVAIRLYYEGVKDLRDQIELHFIDEVLPGYFWIFPSIEGNKEGICNVGAGMVAKDMKKKGVSLEKAMYDAIDNNPLFKKRFENAKKRAPMKGWTLPCGSFVRPNAGNGFVLIGDAASLIDSFTGEGIGNAMYSAWYAADTIAEGIKEGNVTIGKLKEYQDKVEKILRPELETAHRLQKMTHHPWMLNYVIKKASKKPKLAEFIGATLVKENPEEKIGKWRFFLKIFLS
jgi:menaquinone-9 beta-reductase